MPFTVRTTRRADRDVASAVDWLWRNKSKRMARTWLDRLRTTIRKLADSPNQWPEAEEAEDLGLDLREMLHGRRPHVYRILFTIEGDTIVIHFVRHASRDRLTPDE